MPGGESLRSRHTGLSREQKQPLIRFGDDVHAGANACDIEETQGNRHSR
jgi:hypothetical protein